MLRFRRKDAMPGDSHANSTTTAVKAKYNVAGKFDTRVSATNAWHNDAWVIPT